MSDSGMLPAMPRPCGVVPRHVHRPVARHATPASLVLLAALLAVPACAAPAFEPTGGLRLERVVEGLESPVHLTAPARDPRLFIVEQPGRIRIVKAGRLLATPFLDITDRVGFGGERGLLSVAFHPRYASNGFFFVNYTDRHGDTRVERYRVTRDPDRADPASARLILAVDQPYSNHNGGHVLFGPDGMLYVGMGDGGSGGDPQGHGQNRADLLGDLLRLDVDHGDPYAIPPDNPFAREPGARPEVWAYGLRNPWRLCFDRASGLLIIADVGQDHWEEVDAVPADRAGVNFGWNAMEGSHCFKDPHCDPQRFTRPVLEYGHDQGCSITGGFVYRGRRLPALTGCYVFSDYCKGWIRSVRIGGGVARERREWRGLHAGDVTSFGEDAEGEMYVMNQKGQVFRIAAAP